LHDAVIGERLGIPSVAIVTKPFNSAATLMAKVLGSSAFQFVTTTHPISSATETEHLARARLACRDSVNILKGAKIDT